MKRLVYFIAVALIVTMISPLSVFAAQVNELEAAYFADGSYISIDIEEIPTRDSSTKTGRKTYTYRNSSGEEQWKAVLIGTFTYNGSTASCTASSCTVTITNTKWYVISKTTGKSGGTAYADLTMGRKILGITADKESYHMSLTCDKESYHMSLTCDKDGNLS